MANNKRFVLRDEKFGFTLFDRERLLYRFLSFDELDSITNVVKSIAHWHADVKTAPEGIIYSPIRIYYELTNKCNIRCKTCFNSSGVAKPNELSTPDVLRALEGFRRDNVFDIRFSGGEPTQHPDWFEILKFAKNQNLAVSLNTNGQFSSSVAEELASLDLEQICFSVDGGKFLNDEIRGRGAYDTSVRNLDLLFKRKAKLRINTVITKKTIRDIEAIMSLAGQYTREINFFYMRPTGRAATFLSEQMVSYQDLIDINSRLDELKSKYPHVNVLMGHNVIIGNSISTSNSRGLSVGASDGFTRFNMHSDGELWAGGYTPYLRPDFRLGNIVSEDYSILNVWRNSPRLQEFREYSVAFQKRCNECMQKRGSCQGIAIEMEMYRERTGVNPYCVEERL